MPDEASALEELHRRGWTDGLPVVVPTPDRVDAMLAWSHGIDPDVVIGTLGPLGGEATVAKLAINAVMAGCLPEHFPVLLAAVEAVAEPRFNLGPMQETTHCVTPLIVVNGPVRGDIELACGIGSLGPGHRANASIGRALRLIMINVGGGAVGVGDMATFGTPAKFGMCIGEAEEESPFEPLHVARGFDIADSTVTVVPVEAPHSVVSTPDADDVSGSAERLIAMLGAALSNVTSNSIYFGQGSVAVLVNPDHASVLASAGYDRHAAVAAIWEAACQPLSTLRRFNPRMAPAGDHPDSMLCRAVTSADQIVMAVCGGAGFYSMAMPTWAAPQDLCLAITKPVRTPDVCTV